MLKGVMNMAYWDPITKLWVSPIPSTTPTHKAGQQYQQAKKEPAEKQQNTNSAT